jgi:hypothetical protein
VDLAAQELHDLAMSGGADAASAGRAAGDLRAWFASMEDTYVGMIGRRIWQALADSLHDVRASVPARADVSGARAQGPDPRVVPRLQWSLLGWAALVLMLGTAAWRGLLGALPALALAMAGLMCWLGLAAIGYPRQARQLREEPASARLQARRLANALANVRLRADTYAQYVAWASVVGAFLHDPFGRTRDGKDRPVPVGGPLPVPSSWPRRAVAGGGSTTTRTTWEHLFRVGWLAALWEDVLASAPATLGSSGRDLDEPEALFADRAVAPDSSLSQWGEAVRRDGVGSTAGDLFWHRATAQLLGSDAALLGSLIKRIRLAGADPRRSVRISGTELFHELASLVHRPSYFRPDLFTSQVSVDGGNEVRQCVVVTTMMADPGPVTGPRTSPGPGKGPVGAVSASAAAD